MIHAAPLPVTKRRMPELRCGYVLRPRLLAELDAGIQLGVVYVCAPAGSGKTTLVRTWCQRTEGKGHHAWLTLDRADNSPTTLLYSIAAALEGAVPGVGRLALQMTTEARTPSHPFVLASLIHDIRRVGANVCLILDDCQVLTAPSALQALTDLLERRPSELSVVVVSRSAPSLPLERWLQRGWLRVLDGEALRFPPAETDAFLKRTMQLQLPAAHVTRLSECAEGWIVGIELAAESIAWTGEPAEARDRGGTLDRRIENYLFDEVLSDQPEWIGSFMMESAALGRFCAPMCDAVRRIGTPHDRLSPSEMALAEIERANLFLVRLDAEGRWFRYHALIAASLVARLERIAPQHPAELRWRAAQWLSDNGQAAATLEPVSATGAFAHASDVVASRDAAASHAPEPVPAVAGRIESFSALTEREMDVLRCIASGASNLAVAEQLVISPATAKKHTSNIFAKLGVTSRTQALVRAQALQLL